MTVGSELKGARERTGLSQEEISERTKIQLYKIEALESDDFARLPQGIYLDGIVRAYAHELGLPHEPLVERVRAERGTLPGDWPVPFAVPIDLHPHGSEHQNDASSPEIHVLDDLDGSNPLDSFATESDSPPAPVARQEQRESYAPAAVPLPHRQVRQARRSGPVLALLAVLVALGLGAFLYQSRPSDDGARADRAAVEPAENRASPAGTAVGTSGRPPAGEPAETTSRRFTENVITDRDVAPRPEPEALTLDTPRTSDTPSSARRETSKPVVPPAAAARARPAETATTPRASASPETAVETASVSDVTGAWTLATHVESSSLARFQGLQLGYEMRLKQDGDRVTGVGRKVTENGAGIGKRAQTPVTISGRIDGDRLLLNFVERGTRRRTQGKFDLLIDESGTLRGSFSSNAAGSSGRVEAHRVSRQ